MKKILIVFLILATINLPISVYSSENEKEVYSRSTVKVGSTLDKISYEILSKKPDNIKFSKSNESKELHFILYRNNIFIPVSVNDKKSCLFWVDTGGGTSFINSRHPEYKKLYSELKKIHVIDVEKSGKIYKDVTKLYLAKSLKFANIEMSNVVVQNMESDSFDQTIFDETGLEICGMLGTTALSGVITEINYPDNVIKFFPPNTNLNLKNAKKAKFWTDPNKFNLPYVNISLGENKSADFCFDTGFSSSMKITEDSAKELGILSKNDKYFIDSAIIGEQKITDINATKSKHPFNLIGYGIFRNFKITIDYLKEIVYFE